MPAFFIVTIEIPDKNDRGSYDAYIEQVKPIVESFGGKYRIRSEQISLHFGTKAPDRIIAIEFENRRQLENCFASAEYAAVKGLRENSVKTNAIIVEQ